MILRVSVLRKVVFDLGTLYRIYRRIVSQRVRYSAAAEIPHPILVKWRQSYG